MRHYYTRELSGERLEKLKRGQGRGQRLRRAGNQPVKQGQMHGAKKRGNIVFILLKAENFFVLEGAEELPGLLLLYSFVVLAG